MTSWTSWSWIRMCVPAGLFLCAGAVLESHQLAVGVPADIKCQIRPKMTPRHPNIEPKVSQSGPKASQDTPMQPQGAPKCVPRHPNGAPRRPKESPRLPKERQKERNAGPKGRPGTSKRVQRKPIYTKAPDQPDQRPLCSYTLLKICPVWAN